MKKFLSPARLIIIALTLALAVWLILQTRPVSPGRESNQTSSGQLQVGNGGQIFTNVSGDSLQQATPPARSATNSNLSPQQATPNYCAPGEAPILDGCVNNNQ